MSVKWLEVNVRIASLRLRPPSAALSRRAESRHSLLSTAEEFSSCWLDVMNLMDGYKHVEVPDVLQAFFRVVLSSTAACVERRPAVTGGAREF